MTKKALIVEDDPQIAELIQIHLEELRFSGKIIDDGLRAWQDIEKNNYDLILLDLMLPSLDGMELCRKIRAKNIATPLIMLSAKTEEIDKVLGLETGADDYISKPFSIREFQARVKAVMRRSVPPELDQSAGSRILEFTGLKVDLEKRSVYKNNVQIQMTNKEFDLLQVMASHPGKSFSRQNLLNLVWGYDFEGLEHTVNSHINRLRSKIEDDLAKPNYIQTSWGYGYRFNENI